MIVSCRLRDLKLVGLGTYRLHMTRVNISIGQMDTLSLILTMTTITGDSTFTGFIVCYLLESNLNFITFFDIVI